MRGARFFALMTILGVIKEGRGGNVDFGFKLNVGA
jgi:hypothetical protein